MKPQHTKPLSKPVSESELSNHATAPRVTPADIENAIVSEHYFTAADGVAGEGLLSIGSAGYVPGALKQMTFCVLVLWNGYTVTGQSACASPENFDAEIGRRLARQDAVGKVWGLMGFDLRSRLTREEQLLKSSMVPAEGRMETYIGTKVVNALPMNRREYNNLRGWSLPADENGDDKGYLVEYTDRVENPPHVHGFKGYISWSPKEVFERAYRKPGNGAGA